MKKNKILIKCFIILVLSICFFNISKVESKVTNNSNYNDSIETINQFQVAKIKMNYVYNEKNNIVIAQIISDIECIQKNLQVI